MIRARSCRRRRSLKHVKPAHQFGRILEGYFLDFEGKFGGLGQAPASRVVARIAKRPRKRRKKISVQRKNAISLTKVVDCVDGLAKNHHCAGARVVVVYRLILMPLRLWKLSQNSLYLGRQCWRSDRLREETQTSALLRTLFIERSTNLADEGRPR